MNKGGTASGKTIIKRPNDRIPKTDFIYKSKTF